MHPPVDSVMILIILLSIIIFTCQASLNDDFYFKRAYNDIYNALNQGSDASEFLNLMSANSRYLSDPNFTSDKDLVQEYVRATENISEIIYQSPYADFKSASVQNFVENLAKNVVDFPDYFNSDGLLNNIKLFIAAGSREKCILLRSAMNESVMNLKDPQKVELLQIFKTHVNTDFFLISTKVFIKTFLDNEYIVSFINDYVGLFFDLLPKDDSPIHFYPFTLIFFIAISFNLELTDDTRELLFKGLIRSRSHYTDKESVDHLIQALYGILPAIKSNTKILKLVIDLIFSENIIIFIDPFNLNLRFLNIMYSCFQGASEYYKIVINSLHIAVLYHLEIYIKRIKVYGTILICVKSLFDLTENSDEMKLKYALSSITNLRKIFSSYPQAFDIISDIKPLLKSIYEYMEKSLENEQSKEKSLLTVKIITQTLFFNFAFRKIEERPDAAANISLKIGNILIESNLSSEVLSEFVLSDVEFFNEFIQSLLRYTDAAKDPISSLELAAFIKVVNVQNSFDNTVQPVFDQLCLDFIKSRPIEMKGYITIKQFSFLNEAITSKSSFLYFLNKQIENPNPANIIHLEEHFEYLKRLNFLSKSEEMIIDKLL